ncbi:hypothetical protein Tco_0497601 [Tanacetum coccineum]
MDAEVAEQIYTDEMIAKRMEEETEMTVQQKQRMAQVQFEAQYYTKEDWDIIRAKLEANAELVKNMHGEDLSEEDFAKRMVDMINQRKKYFVEERAKVKRSKPMTQTQLRTYMSNYLKNQGTWKLSQLKKLTFEEIKEKFDKLVNQIDTFVPMGLEATKARMKRYSEELQTGISKKQKTVDDSGFAERLKTKARKGLNVDKDAQEDSETDKEEDMEVIGAIPKYGANRPEDVYDRVLWSDLRIMFEPSLSEDAIWSLPHQQKMLNWRYYDSCEVHCLTLEAAVIYMLTKRKYPLSSDACQAMLDMKLQGGKQNKECYQLLKLIEKQSKKTLP